MFVIIFVIGLIFLYIIYILIPSFFSRQFKLKTLNGEEIDETILPKMPGVFLFGNNFDLLALNVESAFNFFRENAKKYKKSYLMYTFNIPIYNIVKAEDVELILNSPAVIQKAVFYNMLKSFLGTGLLTSNGKKWHLRRKLLTPTFHFNILQQFLDIFKEESMKFVNRIEADSERRKISSLSEMVPQFTLNNVCETALGVKLDNMNDGDTYRKNINTIEDYIVNRSVNPWMFYDFIYRWFGDKIKYDAFVGKVHQFSSGIIQKRRTEFSNISHETTDNDNIYESKKKRYAMLDTLLAAEANGQRINHKGICEEVNTFMFEGYDTTSVGLTFSILMLSIHSQIQDRALKEITDLTDDITSLSLLEYNKLKYLDCIIKETLRLYPSVPIIGREVTKDIALGAGKFIFPRYTQILIHIVDVHRDPVHFPDPDKFDPERFLPENTVNRHPFAYLPFSAGPRNCIGQKFAFLEIKVILAHLLMKYKIEPVTRVEDIIFESGLVLRSKNPIEVKFTKR